MRIALVSETLFTRPDGVSNRLRHLLDHLESRGHRSIVIAPQGSPTVYGQTPILSLRRAWNDNIEFPEIGEILTGFQPDIVHVLHPLNMGVEAMRQARHLRLPVVASYDST